MKTLFISLTLVLVGCTNIPTSNAPFPIAPAEIVTGCPPLKTVDIKNPKLSDTLAVVLDNYGQYKECSAQVDAWINWYNIQSKIYRNMP
jgi:hypothetical protein